MTLDAYLDQHRGAYTHLIWTFGEIDCRAHFVKQAELQGRPVEAIIDDTVDRYFEVILQIRDRYDISCLVQGVPPGPDDSIAALIEYPCVGTSAQRNTAAIYFNSRLAERASHEANVAFFSILDQLLTPDLLPVSGCTYDGTHLAQAVRPLMDTELAKAMASL